MLFFNVLYIFFSFHFGVADDDDDDNEAVAAASPKYYYLQKN